MWYMDVKVEEECFLGSGGKLNFGSGPSLLFVTLFMIFTRLCVCAVLLLSFTLMPARSFCACVPFCVRFVPQIFLCVHISSS